MSTAQKDAAKARQRMHLTHMLERAAELHGLPPTTFAARCLADLQFLQYNRAFHQEAFTVFLND